MTTKQLEIEFSRA